MSNQTRASLEAAQRLAGATILQLAPHRPDDPHARGALDIARLLRKAGARPIMAGGNGPLVRECAAAGIEWMSLTHDSLNPFRLRRNASRLEKLIAARHVDIIHAYSAGAAWSALAATERLSVWLVTNLSDDTPRKKSPSAFYQTALARGDHIIAHSAFAAGPMIQHYAIERERVTVIPNRIDAALFDPATMRPERVLALRNAWNVPKGNRVILVPGPIAPSAGQSVLIDAVRRVTPNKLRDVTFVLLGDTRGRHAKQLMRDIAARQFAALFRYGGRCGDWPGALAAADFVVMPAIAPQIHGRPIPESQTMARPVIASAIGILPENMLAPPRMPKALRTGWLVPPGDAAALAQTMSEALAYDLADYRALAARARQFAQFMFSPQNVAASVLNVYSALLGGRR